MEFLGISINPLKVQTPCLVRDVQCFLKPHKCSHKFIKGYSHVVLPLTQLTQKIWSIECMPSAAMTFKHLMKQTFMSTPMLIHCWSRCIRFCTRKGFMTDMGWPKINASKMPSNSGFLHSIRIRIFSNDFAQDILDHTVPYHVSCSQSKFPHIQLW